MARSIGNKLRENAAEVCALMASSNRDEKGFERYPAWDITETSTDRQARDLANETFNSVLRHYEANAIEFTQRDIYGESEALLRSGWVPGEALIDPNAVQLDPEALPEPGNPGLMPADQLPVEATTSLFAVPSESAAEIVAHAEAITNVKSTEEAAQADVDAFGGTDFPG